MKRSFLSFCFLAAASIFVYSCSEGTTSGASTSDTTTSTVNANTTPAEEGVLVGGANMVPSKNIVENAVNSADHTTLVAAVKAAGLVETLSGTGPFTVFAPTNEAFNKLPAGTVDGLLKPEMKSDLTKVLTYHVVPGILKSGDLKDGQKIKTVEGTELTVSIKDGRVMINGANVTIADAVSSNGVTHVIDAVLLPK
ncbi:MAG TPA: fasciclin domain-containing protein [Flavitalea sp.]|nr:fasciclin domain-containing protein [Flavitalea sp.]